MFDRERLNSAFLRRFDQGRLVSGKVHYSNEGIILRLAGDPFLVNLMSVNSTASYLGAIQAHLDRWLPELFLRKLIDWSNEDEYRWVYFDDRPDAIYVDFGDALEAIVIGEHVSDACNEDILRYCVKYRADVANLDWHNGFPKIAGAGQPYITHKHLLNGGEC